MVAPGNKRPLIGIVFFGIPRAGASNFPAIVENIIAPAEALGRVVVRYHFYSQAWVLNPKSSENSALPQGDYLPYRDYSGILEDPAVIETSFDLDKICSYGDAYGDGFVSLKNLVRQLHSLEVVTGQVLAEDPDIVVYVRPDLRYHQSLAPSLDQALAAAKDKSIYLPPWNWTSGGYNDRFAIVCRNAITAYGFRAQKLMEYLALRGKPLMAEQFLKYVLDYSLCRVLILPATATRVRVTGAFQGEKFHHVSGGRWFKYRLREMAKRLVARL